MIRVRTAQTPEKLEALLNEQEKDGFTLKTLGFRGYEAVMVLESADELRGGMRPATADEIVECTRSAVMHLDHPSNWQPSAPVSDLPAAPDPPVKRGPGRPPKNSFKRRG